MQRDWDERAQENAYYYIASGREDWSEDEFYASGRQSVEQIIVNDQDRLFPDGALEDLRVLEIGCGAGRMTRALAELAGEVHGVDVSGEMIKRATAALEDFPNAFVHHGDGAGLDAVKARDFDLAFSYIVFQHIPSVEAIESYVCDVAERLKPGGIFKAQTQGSPMALLGKGDTWEGCYVSAAEWLAWSRRYGYRLTDFEGFGTQYLWLWWRRTEPGDAPLTELDLDFLKAERDAFEAALRDLAAQTHAAREQVDAVTAAAQAEIDEQRDYFARHLLDVYKSPAYRVGRRLGLAPERLPNDETSEGT